MVGGFFALTVSISIISLKDGAMKNTKNSTHGTRGVILLLLACMSFTCFAEKHVDVFLTLDDAKLLHEKHGGLFVDSRSLLEFKKNHISGAVSLPTDKTFGSTGRSDLVASVFVLRDLMNKAGITRTSKIVVYGDQNFLDTARLFWALEMFGLKDVRFMNAPLTKWRKQGYPVETGFKHVEPTSIFPEINEKKLATLLVVFTAINDDAQVILDARAKPEFNGLETQTGVYGHIPTAINVPWPTNLNSKMTGFKPKNELAELYKNIGKDKLVTVYCNKGKESAATYVALRSLGIEVKAYDGSWYEWGMHDGMPIEN
jgi:thiosulfate/3-mercaptopyruvate sulfurtransferase